MNDYPDRSARPDEPAWPTGNDPDHAGRRAGAAGPAANGGPPRWPGGQQPPRRGDPQWPNHSPNGRAAGHGAPGQHRPDAAFDGGHPGAGRGGNGMPQRGRPSAPGQQPPGAPQGRPNGPVGPQENGRAPRHGLPPNGQPPNGQAPNGQAPNGQVPNGQAPNGRPQHVPQRTNGHQQAPGRQPAGAAGVAGAAGGAAAVQGRGRFGEQTDMLPLANHDSYAPEPQLLTHRDDDYLDLDPRDDYDYEDQHAEYGADDDEDDGPSDEELARMRRKRRWKRIRRGIYIAAAVLIIGPIVAFFIAYQLVEVPSPAMVAAEQKKPVTYLYKNGKELDKEIAPGANRELIKPDQIPQRVKRAVYAAEDATFETNSGFDVTGILRAAWNQVSGGSGGGSTITQQYIKQATGATSSGERTYVRKALELVEAFKMNNQQSKAEIITAYLNTIYFGRGAYGIQAAAEAFFDKDTDKLSASQAAFLAGVIQSPGRADDEEYVNGRWNFVMDQMVAKKWLSQSERDSAKLPKRIPKSESQGSSLEGREHLQFVEDRIKEELKSKGLSEEQLQREGAKIYTTLDPRAQQLAVRNAREVMGVNKEYKELASSLVSADPRNGHVLAYYGGDSPTKFGFDLADSPFTPGSSFKPFVLLAALRNDPQVGLGSLYDGSSDQTIAGVTVNNADGESCPQCTVQQAMTQSVNTVFYRMAVDTGTQKVRQAALDAGMSKKVRAPSGNMVDSLATVDNSGKLESVGAGISLGGYEMTATDMAQGYATLANDGNYTPLHFVTKVTDASGENVLYQAAETSKPAFDKQDQEHNKQLARNVTESMTEVADHSSVPLAGGRPNASKTGTAQFGDSGHNQAAWMVGYTPQVVTSVWVGNRGTPAPIYGNYGGDYKHDIYGRMEPSAIWQGYMDDLLENVPAQEFGAFEPLGEDANLSGLPVPTQETVDPAPSTEDTPEDKPSRSREPSRPPEDADRPTGPPEGGGEDDGEEEGPGGGDPPGGGPGPERPQLPGLPGGRNQDRGPN